MTYNVFSRTLNPTQSITYIEVVWENDSEASLNYASRKGKDVPKIRGEQECN